MDGSMTERIDGLSVGGGKVGEDWKSCSLRWRRRKSATLIWYSALCFCSAYILAEGQWCPQSSRSPPYKRTEKSVQTTEIPACIKHTWQQRSLKRSMNENIGISVKDVSYSLETGSPFWRCGFFGCFSYSSSLTSPRTISEPCPAADGTAARGPERNCESGASSASCCCSRENKPVKTVSTFFFYTYLPCKQSSSPERGSARASLSSIWWLMLPDMSILATTILLGFNLTSHSKQKIKIYLESCDCISKKRGFNTHNDISGSFQRQSSSV